MLRNGISPDKCGLPIVSALRHRAEGEAEAVGDDGLNHADQRHF
jgi:hypothetical protein